MDENINEEIIARALKRILENQITIKEHFGIIKERSGYADSEYYYDSNILDELNGIC